MKERKTASVLENREKTESKVILDEYIKNQFVKQSPYGISEGLQHFIDEYPRMCEEELKDNNLDHNNGSYMDSVVEERIRRETADTEKMAIDHKRSIMGSLDAAKKAEHEGVLLDLEKAKDELKETEETITQTRQYCTRIPESNKSIRVREVLKWVLVVIAVAIDVVVIYTVINKAVWENMFLQIVSCLTVCLPLDTLPTLAQKFLHNWIYKTQKKAYIHFFVTIAFFILTYVAAINLRNTHVKDYLQTEYKVQISSEVTYSDEEKEEIMEEEEVPADKLKAAKSLVFLYNVAPLATSAVNFLYGFFCFSEEEKKLYKLICKKKSIEERIIRDKKALASFNYNIKNDLELDVAEKKLFLKELLALEGLLKAVARQILAKHLHDANSTSILSEECRFDNKEEYTVICNSPDNMINYPIFGKEDNAV